MIETKIVNVVVTASLNQGLGLEKIGEFKEISYNSDVYGGRAAYFKKEGMEGKVVIFFSGKMISVGTKSESQAIKELELVKHFLVERGFVQPTKLKPKTQNIVVTADFRKTINLDKLPELSKAIYEPEQFPGAILKLENPTKASVLLFATGKAVITGLKSLKTIESLIQQITQLLEICQ